MKLKLYPNTGLLEILDNKEIFNKAGFTGTINVMAIQKFNDKEVVLLATYDRWMDNCLIFVESANISNVLEDFKLHGDHINIAITIING